MATSVIASACSRSVAGEWDALASWLPAGVGCTRPFDEAGWCDLAAWAATGGMWLSGWPDESPAATIGPVASRLHAAGALLAGLSHKVGRRVEVDLPVVLSGRAALFGHQRRGRISTGESCRLLRVLDGWVAINLARPCDMEAVPAITGFDPNDDPWASLTRAAARSAGADLVTRAQLLGVPSACAGVYREADLAATTAPWRYTTWGDRRKRSPGPWTVVDLSAMWAGPLCAHLLGRAGAQVVKVESIGRPDGARLGNQAFFDWLHEGHASVALDLAKESGRRQLRAVLESADVVIEASRPRALQQLGIDAESLVADRAGRTWVSITGYGRTGPWSNRVAFGDDAAVAGGLFARDGAGQPVFCADAVGDPVTGLFAAVAALASFATGGGRLVDVSMSEVAAYIARPAAGGAAGSEAGGASVATGGASVAGGGASVAAVDHELMATPHGWAVRHGTGWFDVRPPVAPPAATPAAPMGADTEAVLAIARRQTRARARTTRRDGSPSPALP